LVQYAKLSHGLEHIKGMYIGEDWMMNFGDLKRPLSIQ
jgi:hypothetical protein